MLRIDDNNYGKNYDFHQNALSYLYPKVSAGGFIIFDDVYTHPVTMQAWKDFREDFGLSEEISRIDRHSGFSKKTIDKPVDFAEMRKP